MKRRYNVISCKKWLKYIRPFYCFFVLTGKYGPCCIIADNGKFTELFIDIRQIGCPLLRAGGTYGKVKALGCCNLLFIDVKGYGNSIFFNRFMYAVLFPVWIGLGSGFTMCMKKSAPITLEPSLLCQGLFYNDMKRLCALPWLLPQPPFPCSEKLYQFTQIVLV